MKHKHIFALIALITLNSQSTNAQNTKTPAEKILLELHKECNLDMIITTRDAERLIAVYRSALLESTQNNENSQQLLIQIRNELEKIFDNVDSNLELYNTMLNLQQEKYDNYKQHANLIEWCTVSATASAILTFLITKHYKTMIFFLNSLVKKVHASTNLNITNSLIID